MVHFSISMIPFPHPSLSPAMGCQEQSVLTPAQEYDQLECLQADCDSHYEDSKIFGHNVTISATSLVKIFIVRLLRRHWQNHVRTWFNRPAWKTRSPQVHQKMLIM